MRRKRWGRALLEAMLLGGLMLALQGSEGEVAWLYRADALASRKAYAFAVQAYQAAAQWSPRDPLPWLQAGRVSLTQRRLAQAGEALWQAYLLAPDKVETLAALGELEATRGAQGVAALWYRRALEKTGPTASAPRAALYTALGQTLLAEGDLSGAATAFAAALAAWPGDAEAHYGLGLLLAPQQPDQAIAHLWQAAREEALAERAAQVITELEKIRELDDPAARSALLGLAYLRQRCWLLAEQQLAQAVALAPEHAEARAYWGYACYQLGQEGAAEQQLQEALRLDAENAQAYHFLGMLYQRRGWPHEALGMFQEAYTRDTKNPALAADIAQAYRDAGAYEQAEAWYEETVRLAPELVDYALLRAAFHIQRGYHVREQGIPAAQYAIALASGQALASGEALADHQAAAYGLLGSGFLLLGDLSQAEEALQQALAITPDMPDAHYHLAEIYTRQGKLPAAQAHYQRALDLDTGGLIQQRAGEALARLAAPPTPAAHAPQPSPVPTLTLRAKIETLFPWLKPTHRLPGGLPDNTLP